MQPTSLAQPDKLQVSDEQLAGFADIIYRKTGIRISEQKKTLLSNRVRRRLKATGIADFEAYLRHLRRLSAEDKEWDAFLQEITTHETYLFRDMKQWDWLRDDFLKSVVSDERAGKRPKRLRVWSAACSTGDEPVTIACCVADRLPNASEWKVEILATDVGIGALKTAQAATFDKRAMQYVPDSYRRRFFSQKGSGPCKAKPAVTDWISFRQHNLLSPPPGSNFDIVFLKNVLIYFDLQSKETVMRHVIRAMPPGGMLVTSAAEGISSFVKNMERRESWLHQKPAKPERRTAG